MGRININGIKSHSFHGCMDEESKIGADYIVDVEIDSDFLEAALLDDLDKTVDYVQVNKIVEQEMGIRSKLIETVGYRITSRIIKDIPLAQKATAIVHKINPPINGNVDSVSITVTSIRE